MATRVWIKKHYPSVFEEIVFVDTMNFSEEDGIKEGRSEDRDTLRRTRHAIYEDLEVEIVVGAETSAFSADREHARILLHETSVLSSCDSTAAFGTTRSAADWRAARIVLKQLIAQRRRKRKANLTSSLPTLGVTSDLVTISARKSPGHYMKVVNAKLTSSKICRDVGLVATGPAITVAAQAVELLRLCSSVSVVKIATSSHLPSNHTKEQDGQRVPQLIVILRRQVLQPEESDEVRLEANVKALHFACLRGNVDEVHRLLTVNMVPVDALFGGDTPLVTASACGQAHVVRVLLKHGAYVDAQNLAAETALFHSAQNGHVEVVEALLASHADATLETDDRTTAIHAAAQNGHAKVVETLLQHYTAECARKRSGISRSSVKRLDSSIENFQGSSDSHLSTGSVHDSAASLHSGSEGEYQGIDNSSVPAEGASDMPPDALVEGSKKIDPTRALLERRSNAGDGATPLFAAVQCGHLEVVRVLLEWSACPDATNDEMSALYVAAFGGYTKIVHELLAKGATVNLPIDDGATPLFAAAQNGHTDTVAALVERGAAIERARDDGSTPLFIAARFGHVGVVIYLLRQGAAIDRATNVGETPLLVAAKFEHADVLALLLEWGAMCNIARYDGVTALYIAVENGNIEIAKVLLAHRAEVNALTCDQVSPLFIAAQLGHNDVLKLLLENRANPDMSEFSGRTPLYVAARCGHVDAVCALLSAGAMVDSARHNGSSPLLEAASEGHADVARLLLESGATIDVATDDGVTPLFIAAQNGHRDVVALLLEKHAAIDRACDGGSSPLFVAAQFGHFETADLLLEYGASVDRAMDNGATPLYVAAQNGHFECVRILIEKNASVNLAMEDGASPLFVAGQNGYANIVAFLVENGADLNQAMGDGETPLGAAVREGCVDAARVLIEAGAAVDLPTHYGATPLHVAAQIGQASIVQALVLAGADMEARIDDGSTPLHFAAMYGNDEAVRLLLAHGASVLAESSDGETGVLLAAMKGHLSVIETLLGHGAHADAPTRSGLTPLYVASARGNLDVVSFLLSKGANVNRQTNIERTALHAAAKQNHVGVLEHLLFSGAQVDAQDFEGDTPLLLAAEEGHIETVCKLLDFEASTTLTNNQGQTPLLAAGGSGHFDVARALIEAGASAGVRDAAGETILTLAASWGHRGVVAKLFEIGEFVRPDEDDDSLLSVSLQTVLGYSGTVYEFKPLWASAAQRLVQLCDRYENGNEDYGSLDIVKLLFRLSRLKWLCSADSVIERLVSSRMIVSALHDFHMECSFIDRTAAFGHSDPSLWRATFEEDLASLLELQHQSLDDEELLASCFRNDADPEASLCLLNHEIEAHGDKCSDGLLRLLRQALVKACELSQWEEEVRTPDWFIPPHELDIDSDTDGGIEGVNQGMWLSSKVMVCKSRVSHFASVMDKWYSVSHPNVAKIFGASHFVSPQIVVVESALSTSLCAFLSSEEHRQVMWQKLFEVACGIKYLHSREIFVGDLCCDQVWIGSDGLAKVNLFSRYGLACEEDPERVRWQSPECIQGDETIAASSVYALGMCIIEAVTRKVPYHGEKSTKLASMIVMGYRPDQPDQLTSAQWALVEQMLIAEPASRPAISVVVEQLKEFARISQDRWKNRSSTVSIQQPQVTALEDYLFPELACSLEEFLHKLKRKCSTCSVSRNSVQHIFRRLEDVYRLLRDAYKLPSDFVVKNYCQVLLSLDRFLRTAVSATSVLQVAKSQKVTLRNNVFHRDIDSLLELLSVSMQSADPVHAWTSDDADIASSIVGSAEDSGGAGSSSASSASSASGATRSEPVSIVRFETSTLNRRFQEVELDTVVEDGDDAAAQQQQQQQQQQSWLIPIHELKYNRDSPIGVGAFGEVYKAKWLSTPVVVKFMGYEADGDEYSREMFMHELRVWYPLNHPHVIKLFGACHVGKRYFVCEFAGNGTLTQYLSRADGGSEREKAVARSKKLWHKLHEVALGLQYLHGQNIVHNDLKCDNILIGGDGDAKITDFGLSCIPKSAEVHVDQKRQGAQQWKSPEYLRGDRLTPASDVYGFGMCILEAVTGRPPWGSISDVFVRNRVKKGVLPKCPDGLTAQQWSLVEMMCESKPTQRVTIASVVYKLQEFAQQAQHTFEDEIGSTIGVGEEGESDGVNGRGSDKMAESEAP